MGRILATLALFAALSGCYNPRFPSEAPSAATQDDPPANVVRDRRNEAAGSGSTRPLTN